MKISMLLAMLAISVISLAQESAPPEPTSLQHQIVTKETEELNCLKSADIQCFADLIADNAVFLDAHGAATKQQVIAQVTGLKLTDFSINEVHYVPLTERSGLIAYKLTQKGVANGRAFSEQIFVSAIWAQRDGKWVTLFSQETPAQANVGR
jgi:Domain of unknown function (DUF4440)